MDIEKVKKYWVQEARYPDEKRTFREKCTEEFTKKELVNIEEVFKWIKSMLR